MNTGWIIGIGGGIIGLLGGIFGTYLSIRNTNGQQERAFMVKSAAVCWVAVILFLALMFALPSPYRHLLWIPYAILLPLGAVFANRAQQRIRREESAGRSTRGAGTEPRG